MTCPIPSYSLQSLIVTNNNHSRKDLHWVLWYIILTQAYRLFPEHLACTANNSLWGTTPRSALIIHSCIISATTSEIINITNDIINWTLLFDGRILKTELDGMTTIYQKYQTCTRIKLFMLCKMNNNMLKQL